MKSFHIFICDHCLAFVVAQWNCNSLSCHFTLVILYRGCESCEASGKVHFYFIFWILLWSIQNDNKRMQFLLPGALQHTDWTKDGHTNCKQQLLCIFCAIWRDFQHKVWQVWVNALLGCISWARQLDIEVHCRKRDIQFAFAKKCTTTKTIVLTAKKKEVKEL